MATTTYASAAGNNNNACTAGTAPCATISAALTKAVAGGGYARVVVLGPGIFPEAVKLTSTAGAEIIGDGNGFVAIAPPSGGIGIDVSVGSASVRIGNLQILGGSNSALVGIKVVTAGKVDVENVEFHGFATAAIDTEVSTTPYPAMTLSNSVVADGGCFLVHPLGSAFLAVLIENTRIRNCASFGVMVDSSATATAGSATVLMRNSSIESAGTAFEVNSISSSGFATGTIEHSTTENSGNGVVANGSHSTLVLNDVSVTNDHTGTTASGGASVNSYGNNIINWNAINSVGSVNKMSPQ